MLTSYGWFGLVCLRRCYLSTNWAEASLQYSSDSNGGGGVVYVCIVKLSVCVSVYLSVAFSGPAIQWYMHRVDSSRLKRVTRHYPESTRGRGRVRRVEDRAVDMCASVCGTCK